MDLRYGTIDERDLSIRVRLAGIVVAEVSTSLHLSIKPHRKVGLMPITKSNSLDSTSFKLLKYTAERNYETCTETKKGLSICHLFF